MTGVIGIDYKIRQCDKKLIYHFYGHYGTGKTALARWLCKSAISQGKVPIYFDTHGALLHDDIVNEGIDESVVIYIPPLECIDNKFANRLSKIVKDDFNNCTIIIDCLSTLGQRSKTLIERLRGYIYDPATHSLLVDVFIMNNMRSTLHRDGLPNMEFSRTIPYGWESIHSFVDVTFKLIRSRTSNIWTNIEDKITCKVVQSRVNEFQDGDLIYYFLTNGKYDDYKTVIFNAVEFGIVNKINDKFIVDDVILYNSDAVYNIALNAIYKKQQ